MGVVLGCLDCDWGLGGDWNGAFAFYLNSQCPPLLPRVWLVTLLNMCNFEATVEIHLVTSYQFPHWVSSIPQDHEGRVAFLSGAAAILRSIGFPHQGIGEIWRHCPFSLFPFSSRGLTRSFPNALTTTVFPSNVNSVTFCNTPFSVTVPNFLRTNHRASHSTLGVRVFCFRAHMCLS